MLKLLNISIRHTDKPGAFQYYFGMLASLLLAAGFVLARLQPGYILTDGGIFSAVALKDLQGGTLYTDAWENKPPGIFYLSELFMLLTPDRVYGLFAMVFLVFTGSAACMFHLLFGYLKSLTASLLLMGCGLFWMVHRDTIGDGLYTEIYGTFCILLALVFAERFRNSGNTMYAYYTAIAMGFSFWFKEPFVLMCVPLTGLILTADIKPGRSVLMKFILSAALPSLLMFGLLFTGNALQGFADMLRYNFSYAANGPLVPVSVKLTDIGTHLIVPNAGLLVITAICAFRLLSDPGRRAETLSYLGFPAAAALFLLISPYNFGHYNYALYTLLIPVMAALYGLFVKTFSYGYKLPLIILSIYTLYRIDRNQEPAWTLQFKPYTPDRFTGFLMQQSGKSLFVDHADAASYYVKTGLLYNTFLPVPLQVHVDEDAGGTANRTRIMHALNSKMPDFLISANPPSEFSWHYPGFYQTHFQLSDSLEFTPGKTIYLWKRR